MAPFSSGRRAPRPLGLIVATAMVVAVAGCSSSGGPSNAPTTGTGSRSATSTARATTTTSAALSLTPPSTMPGGVVAAGSVTCTDVTGSLAFDPPLTNGGTAPETTQITLTASGCTTIGSSAQVTGATATATLHTPTDSCASLLVPKPVAAAVTWSPSSVHASVIRFSVYGIVNSPGTEDAGFQLPGTGGTASVSGSFAGSDDGAKSSGAIYADMQAAQVLSSCAAPGGLASLTLASGTVALS